MFFDVPIAFVLINSDLGKDVEIIEKIKEIMKSVEERIKEYEKKIKKEDNAAGSGRDHDKIVMIKEEINNPLTLTVMNFNLLFFREVKN